MTQNVGSVDRVVRVLLAVVLLALKFFVPLTGALGVIAIIVAVVLLLTAAVGFCPLYAPFKITTRKA